MNLSEPQFPYLPKAHHDSTHPKGLSEQLKVTKGQNGRVRISAASRPLENNENMGKTMKINHFRLWQLTKPHNDLKIIYPRKATEHQQKSRACDILTWGYSHPRPSPVRVLVANSQQLCRQQRDLTVLGAPLKI